MRRSLGSPKRRRRPIDVRAGDSIASLPAADRTWLAEAGVRLIVPITGGDRQLVGLLMLGDQKSDEPYSADDLTLLQAIARQIGLAHDNVRLKDRATMTGVSGTM